MPEDPLGKGTGGRPRFRGHEKATPGGEGSPGRPLMQVLKRQASVRELSLQALGQGESGQTQVGVASGQRSW